MATTAPASVPVSPPHCPLAGSQPLSEPPSSAVIRAFCQTTAPVRWSRAYTMLEPEVEKTLPSPNATPRMLVVLSPRLVRHVTAPVRPSTANTFCWVVYT